MRFFAENHPDQLADPRFNPVFGSMGNYGLTNCGKKGNREALEFLLNWTTPEGERLGDRAKGRDGNYHFMGLGNFTTAGTVQLALDAGADPNEEQVIQGVAKGLCSVARGMTYMNMSDALLVMFLSFLEGARPLHWATFNGNVGVTEALLKAGADPRIRNTMGMAPLDIAENRGQERIAKLLREELLLWPAPRPAAGLCGHEELPEAGPALLRRIRREHAGKGLEKRGSKDSLASTRSGYSEEPCASSCGEAPAELWV